MREACFKRILQEVRARMDFAKVIEITTLAHGDLREAYLPRGRANDTVVSFLHRAMVALDRPTLLLDPGLAASDHSGALEAYLPELMFTIDTWLSPSDKVVLFSQMATMPQFVDRRLPTTGSCDFRTYFQGIVTQ